MDEAEPLAPLCFVLMPFGKKLDAAGRVTNFDAVYEKVIAPAVAKAGLEPIRADEEKIGGTIHKPMFERLMLCHYAVADITGANPNVFYELGIRHAMRPRSTVIVFGEGTVLPFDIALVRGISYKTDGLGEPVAPETTIEAIGQQLIAARGNPHDDSPIFQLIEGLPRVEVDHSKTDSFRSQHDYSKKYKDRLRAAVRAGPDAVQKIAGEQALVNLLEVESGVVVDLFLSLRDVKAHAAMIELYQRMPLPLQRAKMMREQLGFALNRGGSLRRGREGADRGDRRVRSVERDQCAARAHLQGPLGPRQEGGPARSVRAAQERDQRLSRRLRGRLARCLSRCQRGDADGDDAEGRPAPGRDPPRGALFGLAQGGAAPPTIGTTRRCSSLPCSRATRTMPMRSLARRFRSRGRHGSSRPRPAISG